MQDFVTRNGMEKDIYCIKIIKLYINYKIINRYFLKSKSCNSLQDLLKDTERYASTVASSKDNVSKNRGSIIPCKLPINVDFFSDHHHIFSVYFFKLK